MYGKLSMGGGLMGFTLPVTGINVLFSLMIVFVLIGAGFAMGRCMPKRRTS
jgi:hypothetical protein